MGFVTSPRFFRRFISCCLALFVLVAGVGCDELTVQSGSEQTAEADDNDEADQQDQPAPPAPADHQQPQLAEGGDEIDESLLWRVDGSGGPVWLFGTIHLGISLEGWEAFPPEVQQAIDESEVVVLEVDLRDFDSPQVLRARTDDSSPALSEQLSDDHWEQLQQKVPVGDMLDDFQPWVVYSALLDTMIESEQPTDPMTMVDMVVANEARERGKQLEYLETASEQVEVLSDVIDVEILEQMLDEYEEQQQNFEELVDAYLAGDADGVREVAFEQDTLQEDPDVYERLFVERNRNWVSDIEEYLEQGDVFVAVGAGHLVGEDSVNAMLAEEGYDVERVTAVEDE